MSNMYGYVSANSCSIQNKTTGTGAQGAQGAQGSQGSQGNQGVNGIRGYQGVNGAQGSQGNAGVDGFQGYQGNAGVNGFQGYQGLPGSNGILATGTNYSDYLYWNTKVTPAVWSVAGSDKIHIGQNAGSGIQNSGAIAIGANAGTFNQFANSIAIGKNTAVSTQFSNAIAIGYNALGNNSSSQGENAIALGGYAAYLGQNQGSIAIGYFAGASQQNDHAIAIGTNAGYGSFQNSSIVLNATGVSLVGPDPGFYVSPVRSIASSLPLIGYDATNKELQVTGTRIQSGSYTPALAVSSDTVNFTSSFASAPHVTASIVIATVPISPPAPTPIVVITAITASSFSYAYLDSSGNLLASSYQVQWIAVGA